MAQLLIRGHFAAVLIETGQRYGRDLCLTHNGADAMVEFWDMRHPHDPIAEHETRRGQFTGGRYLVNGLTKGDRWSLPFQEGQCLRLMGDEPEWTVPAEDMRDFLAWLRLVAP